MQKLVNGCRLDTELGSLEMAWKAMKADTLDIARIHENAGADFEKMAQEIATFTEEQKRQAKVAEDTVQKLHSNLKSTYNKFTSQEKTFHQKGEDYDKIQNSLKFSENNRSQLQPKEMDKLRIKEAKAKEELEKNESSYKNLLEDVAKCKMAFEKEMTNMCEMFQTLDEKRIDHMRDHLWKCTNVDSRTCVEQDQCAERMRKNIEPCDIDRDIQLFIKTHRTGSEKPPNVAFKPCRSRPFKVQAGEGDHLYSEVSLP
ncbi:proline-serine-threonine phosphatase-interacting protein 2-like isoform X2 [Crassostrea virginica]|nr:proline-serine-threonine phosphatase-interacting protein 2-like isoform X2 [Crassostrea virginica]